LLLTRAMLHMLGRDVRLCAGPRRRRRQCFDIVPIARVLGALKTDRKA
jgi:hypothetical protein